MAWTHSNSQKHGVNEQKRLGQRLKEGWTLFGLADNPLFAEIYNVNIKHALHKGRMLNCQDQYYIGVTSPEGWVAKKVSPPRLDIAANIKSNVFLGGKVSSIQLNMNKKNSNNPPPPPPRLTHTCKLSKTYNWISQCLSSDITIK